VAEALGVRAETVGLWEAGLARPLPKYYGRIVRFLGYDPEPADGTLAGRLKAVRLRLGLTQELLAARLGLDEGTVSDLERDRRRISPKVARAVERLLREHGGGDGRPSP